MAISMWPKAGCPMAGTSHAMPMTPWEAISKQRLFNTSANTTRSFEQFLSFLKITCIFQLLRSIQESERKKSVRKVTVNERMCRDSNMLLHFLKLTPISCSLNTTLKPVPTDVLKHNINRRIITLNFLPKWCHLLVRVT